MQFMKTFSAALLSLSLLGSSALAADLTQSPTATGVVRAAHTQDLTAPYSGMLLPFDLEVGDAVAAGETLLALDTTPIYAPCSGTLGALFAQSGDDAQSVTARYGGVAAIESDRPYLLNASTRGAYDDPDNKYVHIGETLYFKSTRAARITGVGRVIAVSGESYRVEVTSGELELDETVTLYRDPLYENDSAVGKGVCAAADPIFVQGTGRILKAYVQEGDTVQTGDLLFEAAAPDADSALTSAAVTAPFHGVVSALHVASGQQAAKGQALVTLSDTAQLEIACDVDEIDLGALSVGDSLPVVFDFAPDAVYQGTIQEISSLGTVRQNAAYYTVTLSIGDVPGLRLGMSATVYLAP